MNVCQSGGATGADQAWGDAAREAGHEVRHFVFKGHKGWKLPGAVVVKPEDLIVGDPILKMANEVLGRSFPAHSDFVTNLLRRNYWQVHGSSSVYAISNIDGQSVSGGTAWAVECFKILNPNSEAIYVFDQIQKRWFQWNTFPHDPWKFIRKPPRPTGVWTGIGSREENFTEDGKRAVREVFS